MLSASFSELNSMCTEDKVGEKQFLCGNQTSRILSRHWAMISCKLWQEGVSGSLSRVPFARPEKLFERNNSLKTFMKVTCFRIWAQTFCLYFLRKLHDFCAQSDWLLCRVENRDLPVQKNVSVDFFWEIFFVLILDLWAEFCSNFSETLLAKSSELNSMCTFK